MKWSTPCFDGGLNRSEKQGPQGLATSRALQGIEGCCDGLDGRHALRDRRDSHAQCCGRRRVDPETWKALHARNFVHQFSGLRPATVDDDHRLWRAIDGGGLRVGKQQRWLGNQEGSGVPQGTFGTIVHHPQRRHRQISQPRGVGWLVSFFPVSNHDKFGAGMNGRNAVTNAVGMLH